MQALAEKWRLSGEKPENLYNGETEDIIKELKSWVIAREAWNHETVSLLWSFFVTCDSILRLRNEHGSLHNDLLIPYKAKYVRQVERVKELREIRGELNRRAYFLISTMEHRGLNWPKMEPTSEWSQMDAEVCGCLDIHDPHLGIDPKIQLEALQKDILIAAWHREHALRATRQASCPPNSALPPGSTPAVKFGDVGGRGPQHDPDLPDPVDVTGMIAPPLPGAGDGIEEKEDSDSDSLTDLGEDILTETGPVESAEAIARRIENMGIGEEKEEKPAKVEKKSKTKTRNAQRKKAKDRRNEAAKALCDLSLGA